MISRIKNSFLRRTAICVVIVPLTVLGFIVGAVSGGWEYASEIAVRAVKAWSPRP